MKKPIPEAFRRLVISSNAISNIVNCWCLPVLPAYKLANELLRLTATESDDEYEHLSKEINKNHQEVFIAFDKYLGSTIDFTSQRREIVSLMYQSILYHRGLITVSQLTTDDILHREKDTIQHGN